jgi:hypothetical protein
VIHTKPRQDQPFDADDVRAEGPALDGFAPPSLSMIGSFDYLIYDVAYFAGYEGPEGFNGISGGGLWQGVPVMRDGKIEIEDALLSGVAFYQTPVRSAGRSII